MVHEAMAGHLTLLPCKLRYARMSTTDLTNGNLTQAVLALIFGLDLANNDLANNERRRCSGEEGGRRRTFLVLTVASEEVTLLAETADIDACVARLTETGKQDLIQLEGEDTWRAVQVAEGDLGFSGTGVVEKLSTPLANAGISVMYQSTFSTDFVFIKEGRLDEAIKCLERNQFCFDEDDEGGEGGGCGRGGGEQEEQEEQEEQGEEEQEEEGGGGPGKHPGGRARESAPEGDAEQPPVPLHSHPVVCVPAVVHMTSIDPAWARQHSHPLVTLILFGRSAGESSSESAAEFTCYTETEDEISVLHSCTWFTQYAREQGAVEASGLVAASEAWVPFRVGLDGTPLGFEETGIVAGQAAALSAAHIPIFYVSTFSSDFLFVSAENVAAASHALAAARCFRTGFSTTMYESVFLQLGYKSRVTCS
jgi:hypothetical protein